MKIKIGPVTAEYSGVAAIEEIDADRRVAVFRVSGREVRGQGGATATIRNTLTAASGGGTQLTIDTELQVSGIAAQLGHGMIEDVSATLLGEFAQRLERELAGAPVTAASSGALDVGGAAAVAMRRRLLPFALYAAVLVIATAGAYALGRRR
jgi:carbon monoxide dehydrogenase subunit G